MRDVTIITGPTASGKSSLALAFAAQVGGEIINADSMQVYRDAPILTAQPSSDALSDVPHHGYGMIEACEPWDVQRWLDMVAQQLSAVRARGRHVVIVGGTGFYIRSLLRGLPAMPEIDDGIRSVVRAMTQPQRYDALLAEDNGMGQLLQPGDKQRVSRALEVIRASGKSLRDWQSQPPQPSVLMGLSYRLFALEWPRDSLYARINDRAMQLMADGLHEAAHVDRTAPQDATLRKAVGVAEMIAYVRGEYSEADTLQAIQTNTRRYAKRQLTWIRNQYASDSLITINATAPLSAQLAQLLD